MTLNYLRGEVEELVHLFLLGNIIEIAFGELEYVVLPVRHVSVVSSIGKIGKICEVKTSATVE